MKNILITGGAGYIGSILTPMLLEKNYKVTVLDNFMFQQISLTDVCYNKNLTIIRGDVRDTCLMKSLISKHDILIPLACLVGAPLCDKDSVNAKIINCDSIKIMHSLKSKSQMMIYPCTNSGYGIGQDGIFCHEETALNPISVYGKLKVEAEKHILDAGDSITFRLATVFGISPRMRIDLLVNDFVFRAVKEGFIVLFEQHFKRNYLHVRDAARVFMHAIENYDSMIGNAYNVGISDANISKKELCNLIASEIPNFKIIVSDIREDQDKRNYIISNKKIEQTGYKTKFSLLDGIKELIKGYEIIQRNQFTNV